jgi:hypothetical protein
LSSSIKICLNPDPDEFEFGTVHLKNKEFQNQIQNQIELPGQTAQKFRLAWLYTGCKDLHLSSV